MPDINEEIEENNAPAIVPAERDISFLIDERKHNLAKAHKAIDKEVLKAIEYLGSVVSDENKPTETRIKAAEKIIDSKLKIAQQQNTEFLQRLVQEAKKNMLPLKNSMKNISSSEEDDSEESSIPIYRPDVVIDVSGTTNL